MNFRILDFAAKGFSFKIMTKEKHGIKTKLLDLENTYESKVIIFLLCLLNQYSGRGGKAIVWDGFLLTFFHKKV